MRGGQGLRDSLELSKSSHCWQDSEDVGPEEVLRDKAPASLPPQNIFSPILPPTGQTNRGLQAREPIGSSSSRNQSRAEKGGE